LGLRPRWFAAPAEGEDAGGGLRTQDGVPSPEEAELIKARQRVKLRAYMEEQMGAERAALTGLLAKHQAGCRGGKEEAEAFVQVSGVVA
jgi:hypothetical protein